MDQEFFTNLPLEIIINILSRLPVRTIISCKCICKSWLNLVETDEFVKSHLSNSVPGLAIHEYGLKLESYKFYEFEDELDLEHHELHYNAVTNFGLPFDGRIHSSANGLLFLRDLSVGNTGLYVCNPITRDYIAIHCPREFDQTYSHLATYGFGVSKMSGIYKVVRIFQESVDFPKLECHVYTLGTGSWRRVESSSPVGYDGRSVGVFVNGNLHWMVFDQSNVPLISCFNLETDLFSTPFRPHLRCERHSVGLFALEGCLCICDNSSNYKIDIWLMKEYGVEKSWIKEFVISKVPDFVGKCYEVVYPIKVFKDGDILMAWEDSFLFYYSNKTKTSRKIHMFEPETYMDAVVHTPSFLSLKSFRVKNVRSF
ncbi:hypothetical protein ACS0TY_017184 [Phlomoides rotata]